MVEYFIDLMEVLSKNDNERRSFLVLDVAMVVLVFVGRWKMGGEERELRGDKKHENGGAEKCARTDELDETGYF